MIRAIGERFGSDAKARRSAGFEQGASGQPEQDQRRIERPDRAHDRFGERRIGRRHVVEGAVRLHVLKAYTFASRHSGNGRNLVEDQVFGLGG